MRRPTMNSHIFARCLSQRIISKEAMMWKCSVCGYVYDEVKESVKFEDLPDDWVCPACNAPKDVFEKM
jgi:rubredoxin